MEGGGKKTPKPSRTFEEELDDLLIGMKKVGLKRRSLRESKKPERLTFAVASAASPKKKRATPAKPAAAAAGPSGAAVARAVGVAAPAPVAAARALAEDAETAEALKVARAGIYNPDEALGMASGREAERIQSEKIQKIHKILDAEIELLEKIRRQIQYRRDYFAKKRAEAAVAPAPMAIVPAAAAAAAAPARKSRSRSGSDKGTAPMAVDGGARRRV